MHAHSQARSYVGIINRSQQDIVDNKPIKKALEDERKFFETHKAYKTVAERCGVPYLARTLNRLLLQHITSFLPTLRARLIEMRDDAQNELMRCVSLRLAAQHTQTRTLSLHLRFTRLALTHWVAAADQSLWARA